MVLDIAAIIKCNNKLASSILTTGGQSQTELFNHLRQVQKLGISEYEMYIHAYIAYVTQNGTDETAQIVIFIDVYKDEDVRKVR